ncbi:MAG: hypothetical protein JWQ09_4715 [Segetibacter sp.]|nr:hypothetical protein [Segetibacter sp.]
MCYYNGQRVTRAEFIELKSLEKAVKNYDFLDTGIHNGFTYPSCAIAVATDDHRDLSSCLRNGDMFQAKCQPMKRWHFVVS